MNKMELTIWIRVSCLTVRFPVYSSGSPPFIHTNLQRISAFVIPLLVIVGWITGHDLTLFFIDFETIILFLSVLRVKLLIQDRRSNYMEG